MADKASVTRRLKKNVPLLVGVPEMVPPPERFRPGGKGAEPGANDQV